MTRATGLFVFLVIAPASLTLTGCFSGLTTLGPSLGIASIPIPVSPYYQDQKEDEHWFHERYGRVPILGPIEAGVEPLGRDRPSDDEVMRALERARPVEGGIPGFYEKTRNNVRIVKEKIADYVDEPRVIPLIGPAQLHHVHYKCTVYFTEVTRVGWPIPHTLVDEDAREVVYIDHNHFHMVGNVDTGATSQH